MNLLAIETATDVCSVALSLGDRRFSRHEKIPREHADRILGMIESVLAEAGASLGDLKAIVYGAGPGAFTGVRIAVSVAQGLAFGADLPLVPVSTLWAMAQGFYRQNIDIKQIWVAVDARMGEVYTGKYIANGPLVGAVCEEQLLAPAQMTLDVESFSAGYASVGSAWRAYAAQISASVWEKALVIEAELLPDALDLLTLGEYVFAQQGGCLPEDAQPNYLRNEVAKPPVHPAKLT